MINRWQQLAVRHICLLKVGDEPESEVERTNRDDLDSSFLEGNGSPLSTIARNKVPNKLEMLQYNMIENSKRQPVNQNLKVCRKLRRNVF